MSQYALPITLPPVFSENNFCVSACNREAHAWVTRWPDWPSHALLVYGPPGAGKTHLGHIWAARAKADAVDARSATLSPETVRGNMLVENIESLKEERSLLHALNAGKENGHFLLLTATMPAPQLPLALPDLVSRLKALPATAIAPPDDDALAAVLRKQFADRQLKIDDEAIGFLLPRMERSFAGAAHLVERVDRQALAEKRGLTIPFLKQALGY